MLKRKAPSHWIGDPNEGSNRPRPVVLIIPMLNIHDDSDGQIMNLLNFITNEISNSPRYYKDKLILQQLITNFINDVISDDRIGDYGKIYWMNELIFKINKSKALYKHYKGINTLIYEIQDIYRKWEEDKDCD